MGSYLVKMLDQGRLLLKICATQVFTGYYPQGAFKGAILSWAKTPFVAND